MHGTTPNEKHVCERENKVVKCGPEKKRRERDSLWHRFNWRGTLGNCEQENCLLLFFLLCSRKQCTFFVSKQNDSYHPFVILMKTILQGPKNWLMTQARGAAESNYEESNNWSVMGRALPNSQL